MKCFENIQSVHIRLVYVSFRISFTVFTCDFSVIWYIALKSPINFRNNCTSHGHKLWTLLLRLLSGQLKLLDINITVTFLHRGSVSLRTERVGILCEKLHLRRSNIGLCWRLNTWQQIRGNWGKLWQNGRWGTEQVPASPCQEVYKWGWPTGQSERGLHDNNTDDSSNSKLIPITLAPKGMSKWGQLTGKANSNTHQLTGDISGNTQNVAPHTCKKVKKKR
jgi:hypothetical protein